MQLHRFATRQRHLNKMQVSAPQHPPRLQLSAEPSGPAEAVRVFTDHRAASVAEGEGRDSS